MATVREVGDCLDAMERLAQSSLDKTEPSEETARKLIGMAVFLGRAGIEALLEIRDAAQQSAEAAKRQADDIAFYLKNLREKG